MEQTFTIQKENIDSVFTGLMDRYKQENESEILNFAIHLIIVSNFLMSSFLVCTVISN